MRKNRLTLVSLPIWVCFFSFLFVLPPVLSAQEKEKVILKEIRIAGNLRVEEDGIRLHVKSKTGEPFDPAVVDQDVKSIYRMGFFEDVKADISHDGVLTYSVKEKPYIKEVKIQGNSQVGRAKIESALGISPRTILDRNKISEGIEKVKKIYAEEGYLNARVDYAISVQENNQATVVVDVEEGKRLLIQRISFEGNHAFSEKELKGIMATKEKWFLSFITNRGVLEQDVLTNDMAILSAHYFDHGYINHKVDEPVILRYRDGIEIVIRIQEGEVYRVGKVEIGGDLIQEPEALLKKVQLTSGQIFRGSRLRTDITSLTDLYSEKGYAFAKVEPLTNVNAEEKTVDVALVIARGPPVYFNRILIAGNTKTRDKVVRRELEASEQELFSSKKIKESRNALQRTGYFEDVQITTKKNDQPDAVDLLVDVKEGPTGTFSLGAGYSTGQGVIFTTSVSEKNLFGRGQKVVASFNLGSTAQDFSLGFTEPYFLDTPLSLGVDAFNTKTEFDQFDERRTGFATRTSYPLKRLGLPFLRRPLNDPAYEGEQYRYHPIIEHMRGGVTYEFTRDKIGNLASDAPASIRDEKGTSMTSSITPGLSYDSRDHFFNPTEGTVGSFAMKFAGLGGDSRFIKSDLRGRWHYPLLKDPNWGGNYVLALGGALGYGFTFQERHNGEKNLPLFERYFPGGMNSVRGYKDHSLGPREGNDAIGGDKQAILNAELMFPIMEEYGLRGVAFFDMGQAFRDSDGFDLGEFRRSVGFGARWMSPFGPLRVELGFPLNKKPGDETSVFGFSLGGQP